MRTKGNSGAPDGVKVGRPYHPRDEMACFDRLPRAVRDLLNEAPWKMSAADTLRHVRRHGERVVLRDYRAALAGEGR